jgi:hypothetical protein
MKQLDVTAPRKPCVIVRRPAQVGNHVPPGTWLGELLGCRCGHGIGRHSAAGCEGDIRGKCDCPYDPTIVLHEAVAAERDLAPLYAS